jgi:hypothetical protein
MVRALRAGKVIIENRTNAEVALRYLNKDKKKVSKFLGPQAQFELCPKHCPPSYVKFSNITDLQQRRAVRVVKTW